MRDMDNSRYIFESPQYMIYSGVYEATNDVPPTGNKYWDLFQRGVVDLFVDDGSEGTIYVNENYPETMGWFALNWTQWQFLLYTRRAATVCGIANARYVFGQVGSVRGLILFPDDYDHPDERILLRYINSDCAYSNFNILTKEEFALMESAGAVFLPLAGYCSGSSYNGTNTVARYAYYFTNNANRTTAFQIWNDNNTAKTAGYGDTGTNEFNSIRLVHY